MSDQSGTPSPAAGWYADPAGGGGQRYWDGSVWTEHVAAPVAQPVAPAAPAAPEAPVAPPVAADPAMPMAPAVAVPPPPPAPVAPAYAAAPAFAGQQYAGQQQGGLAYAGPAARSIGFAEAIKRGFAGWTNYSGRATVAEYWWFRLFVFLLTIPASIIFFVVLAAFVTTVKTDVDGNVTSTGSGAAVGIVWLVFVLFFLLLFVVELPLTVRRLHDGDRSGLWIFISFVPFGGLVLLYFMIMTGTPGPNQYGPPVT